MATTTNVFANCNTKEELEFHYEILTSPENISWDGERPKADIQRAVKQIQTQFYARAKELGLTN